MLYGKDNFLIVHMTWEYLALPKSTQILQWSKSNPSGTQGAPGRALERLEGLWQNSGRAPIIADVIINALEINANLKFNFHLDNPTYFQNFNLKIISNLMSGGRLGLGFRVRV